ncbi:MAG: RecB family exonuclease, partial [Candidatus Krumholzibacteriia bacterium]
LRELQRLAAAEFAPGAGAAPQRGLWEETFLAAAPAIVAHELARGGAWRPAALEQEFRLSLGELQAWLLRELAAAGDTAAVASVSAPLPPETARIGLTGWIDRVDLAAAGGQAAVIDYKTGPAPNLGAVRAGDEPQLTLYAVAVETGAVAGLAPAGLTVTEAGYYVFDRDTAGLSPRLDLTGGEGRAPLLAGARRILEDTLHAADRGRAFPLLQGFRDGSRRGNLPCSFCPFRGICRVDERELPAPLRARLAQPGGSR